MNWLDIFTLFREESKDKVAPYLWGDELLLRYAAEAENEVARRTRMLLDYTTPAICQLPVAPGQTLVTLDPRTLFVRRVKLGSQPVILDKTEVRDLDLFAPGWETMWASIPVAYAQVDEFHLRLIPASTLADTLHLSVVRLPLVAVNVDNYADVAPEIPARYHDSLVHWMLFRAYGKQDSQTNDPQKARASLALFEQEFGPKSSALDETWINLHHGTDQYEGLY